MRGLKCKKKDFSLIVVAIINEEIEEYDGYIELSCGSTSFLEEINHENKLSFGCKDYSDTFNELCSHDKKYVIYCDITNSSKKFDYNKFYSFCGYMSSIGHKLYIYAIEMPENYFDCMFSSDGKNLFVPNIKNGIFTAYPDAKLIVN